MVDIIPCDDVVEACGDRPPDGEEESPVKSFPEQPEDFLPLLAGGQEGSAGGAPVPHPRVRMLSLPHQRFPRD